VKLVCALSTVAAEGGREKSKLIVKSEGARHCSNTSKNTSKNKSMVLVMLA